MHIAEKYIQLARDAQTSGDPVLAENYLQHAEHYNRIIMAHRDSVASNNPESSSSQFQRGRQGYAGEQIEGEDGDGDDDGQSDNGNGRFQAPRTQDFRAPDQRNQDFRGQEPQPRFGDGAQPAPDNGYAAGQDRNGRQDPRPDQRFDGRADGRDNRNDGRQNQNRRPFRDRFNNEQPRTSNGDRQPGDRSGGDRQNNDRSFADRPFADRQQGDRPTGDRQSADRQFADRQPNDRHSGDRQPGDRQSNDRSAPVDRAPPERAVDTRPALDRFQNEPATAPEPAAVIGADPRGFRPPVDRVTPLAADVMPVAERAERREPRADRPRRAERPIAPVEPVEPGFDAQPDFLRRPVRRPRREPVTDAGDAAVPVTPVPSDDAGPSDKSST